MATAAEIFQLLVDEKNKISYLDDLDSQSETALWRQIYHSVSQVLQYQDDLTLDAIDTMDAIRTDTILGQKAWWIDKSKNFYQYNTDPEKGILKIGSDYEYYYDTIDEDSKIIDYCSYTVSGSVVTLKVAQNDADGLAVPISTDQLGSFLGFIKDIKIGGSNVTAQSFDNDWLTLNLDVYISGTYIESEIINEIELTIDDYLKNLEFDGIIYESRIIEAFKTIDGVDNIVINSASGYDNAFTVETPFEKSSGSLYKTLAGYARLDKATLIINFK